MVYVKEIPELFIELEELVDRCSELEEFKLRIALQEIIDTYLFKAGEVSEVTVYNPENNTTFIKRVTGGTFIIHDYEANKEYTPQQELRDLSKLTRTPERNTRIKELVDILYKVCK